MKTTNQTINRTPILRAIALMTVLALVIGIWSLPILARGNQGTQAQDEHKMHHQNSSDVIIGKKGMLHFTTVVKVGEASLQPGMYQVQHVMDGTNHVIVFKEVGMQAGYRHGNTPVGKEVARAQCKVEPVTKKAGNTKITLRTNAAGEKEVAEILVAGETFKHIL
jgi:hypothetical protein